jgi:hypothetical protein
VGISSLSQANVASESLELVLTQPFTASTAVNINSVFSSTYSNYQILLDVQSQSTTMTIGLRMRAAGTDASGANYYSGTVGGNYGSAASVYGPRTNAGTSATVTTSTLSGPHAHTLDVIGPALARKTALIGYYMDSYNAFGYTMWINHDVASAYDGFSLIPSTGNITGSVSVYGYRS